jgi:hypothetical protein
MSKMLGIALTLTTIFASTTAVLAQSRYVYGTPHGWNDRADRWAGAEYGSPNYVTNGGRYPFDRQLCCRF